MIKAISDLMQTFSNVTKKMQHYNDSVA